MRAPGLAALLLLVTLVTAPAATPAPGRIAVGVAEGVDVEGVAILVEQATGSAVDRDLGPIGAVVVPVDDVQATLPLLAAIPGVEYVEPIERSRELAFVPNDPLASSSLQWYLGAIQAFDQWEAVPDLPPVSVAVIDSGIDAGHPEFQGRIDAGQSFVGSRWDRDTIGHGTFVAGEIAAALDNGQGIAGVGISAKLVVAKVTSPDGSISVEAEAEGIRWAADQGARVINLSLAAVRDPNDPGKDEYSELEQKAVEYAYARGAVVVAAAGNCDQTPSCPWRFAGYPAALPHVIGVGALAVDGTVPSFSNRDPVYVDVAAPGLGILSTFPRSLTHDCAQEGYSICATVPENYRNGAGTSFAAPLVSAAIALLRAQRSDLTASQVASLLELSAEKHDLSQPGRDPSTGAGALDVVALLASAEGSLPPRDDLEPNDDAGERSQRVSLGSTRRVSATIDYYDDPNDVYRVYLQAGRRFDATLRGVGSLGGRPWLVLWRPGTRHVGPVTQVAVRHGAILGWRRAVAPTLRVNVPESGWYYVEVKAPVAGAGSYVLTLAQRRR